MLHFQCHVYKNVFVVLLFSSYFVKAVWHQPFACLFQFDPHPPASRGSLLPLVLGLPFAPELQRQPWARLAQGGAEQGAVAQRIMTYIANFAFSG